MYDYNMTTIGQGTPLLDQAQAGAAGGGIGAMGPADWALMVQTLAQLLFPQQPSPTFPPVPRFTGTSEIVGLTPRQGYLDLLAMLLNARPQGAGQ